MPSKCTPQRLIVGTDIFDGIQGTELADKIGAGPDRINCGAGKKDVANVDRDDTTKACEVVNQR